MRFERNLQLIELPTMRRPNKRIDYGMFDLGHHHRWQEQLYHAAVGMCLKYKDTFK